jgi:hypothetical protein
LMHFQEISFSFATWISRSISTKQGPANREVQST